MRRKWIGAFLAVWISLFPSFVGVHAEYSLLHGVIHLDSSISGGDLSPEELIRIVRDSGLQVAIITDHDTMRWEYGLPFLRRILRKVMEKGSISTYGAGKYMETIERIDRENPEVLFIHGAEAIPFYYWEGGLWSGTLTLKRGHEHLLVIGLEKASDYEHLPSVGGGFPRVYGMETFLSLWPVVLLLIGAELLLRMKGRGLLFRPPSGGGDRRLFKVLSMLCFGVGVLFLINNYPYGQPRYDPYHRDQGVGPYQYMIDYVNQRGGMTFWAHPEVHNLLEYELLPGFLRSLFGSWKIKLETVPYHEDLLRAFDYTGFAVFAEGMKHTGVPGGIWDQVLSEYCRGERKRPVWAIGEVDFEAATFSIKDTETVFLVAEETREEVLTALRKGRMYAIHGKGTQELVLDRFVIVDEENGSTAYMGDEIPLAGRPRMHIEVSASALPKKAGKIVLIRNGEEVKAFDLRRKVSLDFEDEYYNPGERVFYRLDIKGTARIISNPIFVRFVAR